MSVLSCNFIESTIVYTKSELPILLLDEYDRGFSFREEFLNPSSLQVLLEIVPDLFLFVFPQGV